MIRIDWHGAARDQALKTYVEQRIRSFGLLDPNLGVVTVRLAHGSGLGGFHARCRMMARPVPWADVVVEETDVDPHTAIDRSAERLADFVALARRARDGQSGTAQPDSGVL